MMHLLHQAAGRRWISSWALSQEEVSCKIQHFTVSILPLEDSITLLLQYNSRFELDDLGRQPLKVNFQTLRRRARQCIFELAGIVYATLTQTTSNSNSSGSKATRV